MANAVIAVAGYCSSRHLCCMLKHHLSSFHAIARSRIPRCWWPSLSWERPFSPGSKSERSNYVLSWRNSKYHRNWDIPLMRLSLGGKVLNLRLSSLPTRPTTTKQTNLLDLIMGRWAQDPLKCPSLEQSKTNWSTLSIIIIQPHWLLRFFLYIFKTLSGGGFL